MGGVPGGVAGPMVGRDRELEQVTLLLDEALAGHAGPGCCAPARPAFQAMGLTDVAAHSQSAECEAGELFIR